MTAAERFAQARPRLLRLAYSELGDVGEAEDVVQEAWLRLERADAEAIENLDGWLTTVVARLALDRLRSARARRETYVGPWLPEPLVSDDPADRVTLDESVSYALLTVLEQLSPAERTAFVLHDVFDVPFGDVAEVVGRTPEAVRQLASRARRHVKQRAPALRGLARRARPRRASVRAGGRRGQPRGPCRGARPGCRLDVGRRRARDRRAQAAARRGAGRARVGGARPQVARTNRSRSSSTGGSGWCSRAATAIARRSRSSSATVASRASTRSATRRSCGASLRSRSREGCTRFGSPGIFG